MKDNPFSPDSPLARNNRRHGMTVPEGYFQDFAKRMEESLPDVVPGAETSDVQAQARPRRTVWQKIRPYVYMAAMFAGVWCMMKVFDHVRTCPVNTTMEVNQNPVLAEALGNDQFVEQYFYDDLSDDDLMWLDMQEDGSAPLSDN